MLLHHCQCITQNPAAPEAVGLLIAADKIVEMYHSEAEVQAARARLPNAHQVDLHGATVLPGLTDAHFHLHYLGSIVTQLDLTGTSSLQEVLDAVAVAAQKSPQGAWIKGRGWDENLWATGTPHRRLLDDVASEHPVWLERVDGHAGWCNSKALQIAQLGSHPTVPFGGFMAVDSDGQPQGVFVDNAMDLVRQNIPTPPDTQIRHEIQLAMQRCAKVGLVGIHDMGTEPHVLKVLKQMDAAGELSVRVSSYLYGDAPTLEQATLEPPWRGNMLHVVGVKLFVDGALGSHGAAMIAPYIDKPESTGLLMHDPLALERMVSRVHRAGYQVAIHAIGDRANRLAVQMIANAQAQHASGTPFLAHRIEHAQVVDDDDFELFKNAGCIASVQPIHAMSDMHWVEGRISPRALQGAYAWRRFLNSGVPMALGSDAPVEDENPWWGIHAAVTRQNRQGQPAGGWRHGECLTLAEALAGFTQWPHTAVGSVGGVLRPGALADLTVIDKDPRAMDPAQLWQVQTLATVVAGVMVYRA